MESGTKPFWASKWYFVYLVLSIIILAVWAYSKFVLHACVVSGESMEPTFHDGDILSCSVGFDIGNISRGDIVCFSSDKGQLIKRVIALPGESICVHNGQFLIKKDNEYISSGYDYEPIAEPGIVPLYETGSIFTLADDEFFCVGDNRNYSIDSRVIGPVKFYQIDRKVNKAVLSNAI